MENVDEIVLLTLKKFDCSFCDNAENLADLSREDVLEGIIKLLWSIDSKYEDEFKSWKVPGTAAKKYQTATSIANAINSLGIREKFGYQSILYPNVYDVRKIFISLIDKLPEEKVWMEREISPFMSLMTDISQKVDRDLKRLWVPYFCRRLNMVHDGHYWNENTDLEIINFKSTMGSNQDFRQKMCSILGNKKNTISPDVIEFPFATSSEQSNSPKPPVIGPKPVLKPKPKPRVVTIIEDEIIESNDKRIQDISTISDEIDQIKHEIMEYQYAKARLEDDMDWMKENMERIDPQLLELLNGNDDCIIVLNEELSIANESLLNTQELFSKSEQELDNEYVNIKISKGLVAKKQDTKSQIESIKGLISKKMAFINESRRQIEILKKRVDNIVTNTERASYREGIMDLMQNINSQYNEKIKIYEDNCSLIKELEFLNGNLNRTYSAVEKWMTVSSSIGKLQKAFRNLIAMHERCFAVRSLIKECSTISREIDEIMDDIEIQSQNAANIHLDEIMADIAQIEQENYTLKNES